MEVEPSAWNAIAGAPAFRALQPDAISDLAARAIPRHFTTNTMLVGAGSTNESVYLVTAGRVDVVVYGDSRLMTLQVARRGDLVGDDTLFSGEPAIASSVACEPTAALVLPRAQLFAHLERFPSTAMQLIRDMTRRMRRANLAVADLAMNDAEGRFVQKLVRLAREDGVPRGDGVVLERRPTQQDVANLIGSRRETVSRLYNRFVQEGLLVPHGRRLLVTAAFLARARVA
jgi:CRP-like cAMP-binding protein